MIKEDARREAMRLLKECATEGTFWNRHFKADDVIDLWRETNRIFLAYGEEPVSFDVFYIGLQKFKEDYTRDFEEAAKAFLKMMEEKPEVVVQQKPEVRARTRGPMGAPRQPRIRKTGGGKVHITGTFNPEGQPPIEMELISAPEDWRRFADYVNRSHDDFVYDLFFTFLTNVQRGNW